MLKQSNTIIKINIYMLKNQIGFFFLCNLIFKDKQCLIAFISQEPLYSLGPTKK